MKESKKKNKLGQVLDDAVIRQCKIADATGRLNNVVGQLHELTKKAVEIRNELDVLFGYRPPIRKRPPAKKPQAKPQMKASKDLLKTMDQVKAEANKKYGPTLKKA